MSVVANVDEDVICHRRVVARATLSRWLVGIIRIIYGQAELVSSLASWQAPALRDPVPAGEPGAGVWVGNVVPTEGATIIGISQIAPICPPVFIQCRLGAEDNNRSSPNARAVLRGGNSTLNR